MSAPPVTATDTAPRDTIHSGGCLCGAVRFAAFAEPREVGNCHCSMCRRALGSAYASFADFALADFAWTQGEAAVYRSSKIAERGFCAICGTSLFFRFDHPADYISVLVGCFENPSLLAPTIDDGIEGHLPWVALAPDLPARRTEDHPHHAVADE